MLEKKLVICEKPSQAQTFSAVLNAKKRGDGFFEGNGWLISWCYGHLVELAPADAYGEQYKKWAYETLPFLPDASGEAWQYQVSADKKKQFDVLRSLMKRADVQSVVCATDAGREGELIFRLVYEQARCTKPIQRLWISSLEDEAVRKGFASLRPGSEFDNLYKAALSRAKADYLVGINATRLFSCLYGATLNVGRVQSPTLALIVVREAAIRQFVSEAFYTPQIVCSGSDGSGGFVAVGKKIAGLEEAESVRIATNGQDAIVVSVDKQKKDTAPPKLYDLTALQRDANRLLGFTAQQTLDYVQSLYEKKLCSYPRTDSRYLTSDMAEGLPALVEAVAGVLPFYGVSSDSSENNAKKVNRKNGGINGGLSGGINGGIKNKPSVSPMFVVKDSAVTDHHAIIPTAAMSKADLSSLPNGERDVLFMIATRLLCAVGTKHSYEAVTVVLGCAGHVFTVKGKTVLADGWKAVDSAFRASLKSATATTDGGESIGGNTTDDESGEDGSGHYSDSENLQDSADSIPLPSLTKDQVFTAISATVKEGKTAPPARFNDASLLAAMETAGVEDFPDDVGRQGEQDTKCPTSPERKGLGTPATRAATIEKLIKTGFVERKKKSLVPTPKGINLIAVLPDNIKSPLLTADWEQKLKQIERGELSDSAFMDGISALISGLVAAHNAPIGSYAALFATASGSDGKGSAGQAGRNDGEVVGDCPRCKSPVVMKPKPKNTKTKAINNSTNTNGDEKSGVESNTKSGAKSITKSNNLPDYYCTSQSCKFAMWADNRFFTAKKKKLDKKTANVLLKEGRVFFSDLYSKKTGKTYGATIVLDDDGARVNFKLEFANTTK